MPPGTQVGGDFYDWLPGDDAIRLSLGDVMGKGMPASLLTATVRAALRAVEDLPVSAAVEAVNRALSPDLIRIRWPQAPLSGVEIEPAIPHVAPGIRENPADPAAPLRGADLATFWSTTSKGAPQQVAQTIRRRGAVPCCLKGTVGGYYVRPVSGGSPRLRVLFCTM